MGVRLLGRWHEKCRGTSCRAASTNGSRTPRAAIYSITIRNGAAVDRSCSADGLMGLAHQEVVRVSRSATGDGSYAVTRHRARGLLSGRDCATYCDLSFSGGQLAPAAALFSPLHKSVTSTTVPSSTTL